MGGVRIEHLSDERGVHFLQGNHIGFQTLRNLPEPVRVLGCPIPLATF